MCVFFAQIKHLKLNSWPALVKSTDYERKLSENSQEKLHFPLDLKVTTDAVKTLPLQQSSVVDHNRHCVKDTAEVGNPSTKVNLHAQKIDRLEKIKARIDQKNTLQKYKPVR